MTSSDQARAYATMLHAAGDVERAARFEELARAIDDANRTKNYVDALTALRADPEGQAEYEQGLRFAPVFAALRSKA